MNLIYVNVFMRENLATKTECIFWVTDSSTHAFWRYWVKLQLSVLLGPSNFIQNSAGIKSGTLNYFVLAQCKYEVLYIDLNCFFMLYVRGLDNVSIWWGVHWMMHVAYFKRLTRNKGSICLHLDLCCHPHADI